MYRPTVAYGVVTGNCSIMGITRFTSLYFRSLSHIDSDAEQFEFVTSSPNIKSFDSSMKQNVGQNNCSLFSAAEWNHGMTIFENLQNSREFPLGILGTVDSQEFDPVALELAYPRVVQ